MKHSADFRYVVDTMLKYRPTARPGVMSFKELIMGRYRSASTKLEAQRKIFNGTEFKEPYEKGLEQVKI